MICVGPIVVVLEPMALREASDVEPVPCPALPVLRARQEAIDEPSPCRFRRVREKRSSDVDRRRHPGQVEIDAPQERPPRSGGIRLDSSRLELAEHEPVDGATRPILVGDRRWSFDNERAKRPFGAGFAACRIAGTVARSLDERSVRRRIGRIRCGAARSVAKRSARRDDRLYVGGSDVRSFRFVRDEVPPVRPSVEYERGRGDDHDAKGHGSSRSGSRPVPSSTVERFEELRDEAKECLSGLGGRRPPSTVSLARSGADSR